MEDYTLVATYTREDDEHDGKSYYGVHWMDGDEILWTDWFETEEEREAEIDRFCRHGAL